MRRFESFSDAFEYLRGKVSYMRLASELYHRSDGGLQIDQATLQRWGNDRVGSIRALDCPEKRECLCWCMMLVALDRQEPLDEVLMAGRLLLARFFGVQLAELMLCEIQRNASRLEPRDFVRWFREYVLGGRVNS